MIQVALFVRLFSLLSSCEISLSQRFDGGVIGKEKFAHVVFSIFLCEKLANSGKLCLRRVDSITSFLGNTLETPQ